LGCGHPAQAVDRSCLSAGVTIAEGQLCPAEGDAAATVCVDSRCVSPVALATGQFSPFGLTVGGGWAYWANQDSSDCNDALERCGQIVAAPVDGSSAPVVLWDGSGVDHPEFLAVNDRELAFTSWNSSWGGVGTMTLAGGGQGLVYFVGGVTHLEGCAMDETNVYFADSASGLWVVPIDGSTSAVEIAKGNPNAVALDSTHVYWTDDNAGTLSRAALDGSQATVLATGVGTIRFLALDSANVYFTESTKGIVGRVPLGGGPVTVLANAESEPLGVAVDRDFVYWSNNVDGTIRRTPVGGGALITLAFHLTYPVGVAVDENNVYWTEAGTGAVMRLPK
jgi:hypothetical protein